MYLFEKSCRTSLFLFLEIAVLALFLSGCTSPIPSATIAPPTCTPLTPDANVYVQPSTQGFAGVVYQIANPQVNDQSSPIYQNAQQQALLLLTQEVERWSANDDVTLSQDQVIRITVTFLSPELLEAILVKDYLRYHRVVPDITTDLQNHVGSLASRTELLFMLTITTTHYDPHAFGNQLLTVKLPLKEMLLKMLKPRGSSAAR